MRKRRKNKKTSVPNVRNLFKIKITTKNSFLLYFFSFSFLFFFFFLALFSKYFTLFLSSFNRLNLLEIRHILNISVCQSQTLMFKKKAKKKKKERVERTYKFCLARKLTSPLVSSDIFIQWGWLIPFCSEHFPGQFKDGERAPIFFFLWIIRAGRTYFLSSLFIAAEPLHHEESHLIYGRLSLPSKTKGSQLNISYMYLFRHLQEHFYVASNFCYVYSDE